MLTSGRRTHVRVLNEQKKEGTAFLFLAFVATDQIKQQSGNISFPLLPIIDERNVDPGVFFVNDQVLK